MTRKNLARQLDIDEVALAKREKDLAYATEGKVVQLTNFPEQQFRDMTAFHA